MHKNGEIFHKKERSDGTLVMIVNTPLRPPLKHQMA